MLKLLNAMRRRRAYPAPVDIEIGGTQRRDLPADLEAAIEGCYVYPRSEAGDGSPRAVVQLAGRNGGWVHSIEASRDAIAARWPDLSEPQLRRALRFLDSVVAIHLRPPRKMRKGTNFVNSWREDDFDA